MHAVVKSGECLHRQCKHSLCLAAIQMCVMAYAPEMQKILDVDPAEYRALAACRLHIHWRLPMMQPLQLPIWQLK